MRIDMADVAAPKQHQHAVQNTQITEKLAPEKDRERF
jgi:hypothetical protein